MFKNTKLDSGMKVNLYPRISLERRKGHTLHTGQWSSGNTEESGIIAKFIYDSIVFKNSETYYLKKHIIYHSICTYI